MAGYAVCTRSEVDSHTGERTPGPEHLAFQRTHVRHGGLSAGLRTRGRLPARARMAPRGGPEKLKPCRWCSHVPYRMLSGDTYPSPSKRESAHCPCGWFELALESSGEGVRGPESSGCPLDSHSRRKDASTSNRPLSVASRRETALRFRWNALAKAFGAGTQGPALFSSHG
jgi:hypothetical protein